MSAPTFIALWASVTLYVAYIVVVAWGAVALIGAGVVAFVVAFPVALLPLVVGMWFGMVER